MKTIDAFMRLFSQAGGIGAGVCIVIMMLHVAADVLGRNLTNAPIPGTLDYITYWWVPLSVFLALGLVHRTGQHVEATLFTGTMTGLARSASFWFTFVVTFVVALMAANYAVLDAVESFQIREAVHGTAVVPIWIPKSLVALGLVGLLSQILLSPIYLGMFDRNQSTKEVFNETASGR